MNDQSEQKTTVVQGLTGRDANKRYRVTEMLKLTAASMALRLVAALHVESYEDLIVKLQGAPGQDGAPIEDILQLLQGCNPVQLEALMREALNGMEVAPDPQHPEAFRPMAAADISELRTLGSLLTAFVKLNFTGA